MVIMSIMQLIEQLIFLQSIRAVISRILISRDMFIFVETILDLHFTVSFMPAEGIPARVYPCASFCLSFPSCSNDSVPLVGSGWKESFRTGTGFREKDVRSYRNIQMER